MFASLFRIRHAIVKICEVLTRMGQNNGFDLSLADEIFAIFAGVTLAVSATDWLFSPIIYLSVIVVIFISVSLVIIFAIVVINQRQLKKRVLFYLLTLISAVVGVEMILDASHQDLAPNRKELYALPAGVIVWMMVREFATFLLNILIKRKAALVNDTALEKDRRPNF